MYFFASAHAGGQSSLQAIYGGVEFGLDRFELAQRHALQGQPGMQLGQSGRTKFGPTWADLSYGSDFLGRYRLWVREL